MFNEFKSTVLVHYSSKPCREKIHFPKKLEDMNFSIIDGDKIITSTLDIQ